MNVSELIEILKRYNPELPVFIANEGYGNLERAGKDSIFYCEIKEYFTSEDKTPAICLMSSNSYGRP